eukprot:scaffold151438_cov26-Tisochrysis_lutea.AAC.1
MLVFAFIGRQKSGHTLKWRRTEVRQVEAVRGLGLIHSCMLLCSTIGISIYTTLINFGILNLLGAARTRLRTQVASRLTHAFYTPRR